MDKKIIAVAIAAVIVVAGVGVFLTTNHEKDDKGLSLLARVNTEGSGIYLKAGEKASDYLTIEGKTVTFKPAAWGGKIFGTPGVTTIQHMQLKEIVEDKLHLKFVMYREGADRSSDTVYYDAGIPNYTKFKASPHLTGAFIWQVQYQLAVNDGCVGLIMTDLIFPDHTCCVIAGNNKFVKGNGNATVKFLAGYIKSVDKLNAVLSGDHNSAEFKGDLVTLTANKTNLDPNKQADRNTIEQALMTIKYVYSDNVEDLAKLKTDIASLAEKYVAGGIVQKNMSDLGFKNSTEFANKFVQSSYLKKAMTENPSTAKKVNVTVAAITGDIHQIAIHYGEHLGYFAQYGVTVTMSGQTNGPGVAVALQNGGADVGLLGAPPLTIRAINEELVKGN